MAYTNPDEFCAEPGAVTFIYNGQLYWSGDGRDYQHYGVISSHGYATHCHMLAHPEVAQAVLGTTEDQGMIDTAVANWRDRYRPPQPAQATTQPFVRERLRQLLPHGSTGSWHQQTKQVRSYEAWDVLFDRRRRALKRALLGRVSAHQGMVSFWNDQANIYQRLLPGCVRALLKRKLAEPAYQISTPLGNETIAQCLTASQLHNQQLSPEQERQLQLAQRVHLATGAEKVALMKQLGLYSSHPGRQHNRPMGLAPGHWWRFTSERFERRLDAILEAL